MAVGDPWRSGGTRFEERLDGDHRCRIRRGLPIFGLSMSESGWNTGVLYVAAGLLTVLLLGLLAEGCRALFGSQSELLRRATLLRILVPACVFGMLVMAAAIPLYHSEEKRWIARDRLTEITSETPGFSRYEYELTQVMRNELVELLGD